MTERRDPDAILAAWLDEGPTDLPDATRRAVLAALPTTTQARRGPLAPWRLFQMNSTARLAVGALVAVIAVSGALYLFGPRPSTGPGGAPTPTIAPSLTTAPSPTTAPAATLDTAAWTTYTSTRYGFTIGHPADWPVIPSNHNWAFPADATDFPPSGGETFHSPAGDVAVSAWSVAVAPGTTITSWLQTYCPAAESDSPCSSLGSSTIGTSMDGHAGSLVRYKEDTQAYILIGNRLYIVGCWRPESDPTVAPYGGATRLLNGYLSTMHLLPAATPVPTVRPS
jgi:hypothetical protein